MAFISKPGKGLQLYPQSDTDSDDEEGEEGEEVDEETRKRRREKKKAREAQGGGKKKGKKDKGRSYGKPNDVNATDVQTLYSADPSKYNHFSFSSI